MFHFVLDQANDFPLEYGFDLLMLTDDLSSLLDDSLFTQLAVCLFFSTITGFEAAGVFFNLNGISKLEIINYSAFLLGVNWQNTFEKVTFFQRF